MKYFIKTSDNARILVEDLNSDVEKTILFIHGWPLNHNVFEYQIITLYIFNIYHFVCYI